LRRRRKWGGKGRKRKGKEIGDERGSRHKNGLSASNAAASDSIARFPLALEKPGLIASKALMKLASENAIV